jgi:hypothetical protein
VVTQQPHGAGGMQQQQQWGRWPGQQQQQQGMMAPAPGVPAGLSPDLMAQLFQMGTAMGAALQQQAGGAGAAGAAAGGPPSAAAMAAAMEAVSRMWGGADPAMLAQQMGALAQQQAHQ